jgi:hypothetical protein
MTSQEIKKQIIKDIITPFFRSNGFTKRGVKYFNTINHLIYEAWIQTLKYRKIENTNEFRIEIKVIPENSLNVYFKYYRIPKGS